MGKSKSVVPQSPSQQARKPTDIDIRIGQLIRERRQELSMSQDELSKALQIAQHQLQKYETGENRISASRLVELARVLRVAITWFYQWTEPHLADTPPTRGSLDETTLIETFRDLTPAGRAQLVSIAEVLRGQKPKALRRRKHT